jgi:iron complex outermembrane receptor protein
MKSLLTSASIVCLMAAALPAVAQSTVASGASQSPDDSPRLGEVVVTAQKRAENVQRVAAAVSAVGAVQIAQSRIQSNDDLKKLAPSVNITTYFNIPSINIRGLGNEASNPSADASVATYIDGVYQARPTSTSAAFEDLQRIEVLRGPQGTLYGRNTTGGVVNLITRTPGDTFAANIYASYGSYNEAKISGGVEGPLSSIWDTDARLSFYHDSNTGTMIDTVTGRHSNNLEADGVRFTLVTHPTSNLKVTLRGDGYHDYSKGNSPQITSCEPYSDAILSSPCNPGGILPNAAAINAQLGLASNSVQRGIYYFSGLDGIHYQYTPGTNFVSHTSAGGSVTVDWDITPKVSLKSISSLQYADYDEANDADGSYSNYINFVPGFDENSYAGSQEFDLSGHLDNGAVWSVGAFAFSEYTHGLYLGAFPGLSVQYTGAVAPSTLYDSDDHLHTHSYSAFAQASAPITSKINVTAGVRETYDTRSTASFTTFGPFGSTPLADCLEKLNYSNTTYKVGTDFEITSRNMLYATVSTGFKAGGANEGVCNSPFATFRPENVTAYEFGSKNVFLDGKLLINADVYYYNYGGYQADVLTGGTVEVINAANAVIDGVEFEVQAKPVQHLTLGGNLGYSHSAFQNFVSANPTYGACPATGGPAECQTYEASLVTGPFGLGQNLSGNTLPHSPKWTVNGQAEYVIPIPSMGDDNIRLHYDVSYNSGWYGDIFNEAINAQKAYTVHDASVAYVHRDYEFGAFIDNFTNALYAESKYSFSTAAATEANWAPLRRWGIYIRAKW